MSNSMDDFLYRYKGIIKHVVDGDTYDVMVDVGFSTYKKIRVRLTEIDTPEKYGKVSDAEREHGKQATEFAKENFLGKECHLRTYKDRTGKYGRYLASIWVENEKISDLLKEAGFEKKGEYPEDPE